VGRLLAHTTKTAALCINCLSEEGDESPDGSLTALLRNATITGNSSAGIQAEQTAPGMGTLTIQKSNLAGNDNGETDLDGVILG